MMGHLPDNGHFTEILVKGHQNPTLLVGASENFIISRILGPISGPNDIMTIGA